MMMEEPVQPDGEGRLDTVVADGGWRHHFLTNGYCVLRHCVPSGDLPSIREAVEVLAQRRIGGGGLPESYSSFRLSMADEVPSSEADRVVRFCLGPNTLGVSDQLVNRGLDGHSSTPVRHTTICLAIGVICSGNDDHGATDWHRDASSSGQAPLGGMQRDMQANGVGYVQWNIALEDDEIFWLIPGSHRQPDSAALQQALLDDPCVEIHCGVPIKLQKGDGVVYSNVCLHWGSQYNSTPTRRTLHLSYRAIGVGAQQLLSKSHSAPGLEEPAFADAVPKDCGEHFRLAASLLTEERATMVTLFRAVIDRDEEGFDRALAALHVGTEQRMVAVVLLSKIAKAVGVLCSSEIAHLPLDGRQAALEASPNYHGSPDWPVCQAVSQFSPAEASVLVQRFSVLDMMLKREQAATEEATHAAWLERRGGDGCTAVEWASAGQPAYHANTEWPDWEARPLRTTHHAMPAMSVREFIGSWQHKDVGASKL